MSSLRDTDHQAVYGYLADLERGVDRSAVASGAPAGSNLGYAWTGGPSYVDAFGARRAPTPPQLVEAYKSLIYFCVEVIAKRVQRNPLRLYVASGGRLARPRSLCSPRPLTRTLDRHVRSRDWLPRNLASAERIEEVTEHPFLTLLDHPDPFGYFNRRSLIGTLCRYLDVTGTGYVKPFGLGDSFPEELWPLQSQYVLGFNKGSTALIEKYQYFTETYKFEELVRVRWESLRNPYGAGYGPTQAAIQYARLEDSFVSIQEQVLDAGPRPGMIVSPDNPQLPLGSDEAKRLEQDLNRKFSRGAAARVWVQQTPLKAQVMTYPPGDLAGLQISDYDMERTCNCFGVPPTMTGKDTNLANMEASEKRLGEDAIEPRCDLIASELTSFVRRYDERLFVAFDPVLKENEERTAKVFDMGIRNGSFSPDEYRQEAGWEPAKNWDG
ncbi:MAG: phage portal protein, partial [Cyanobacteria bacterium REEB65]|nr:phage portal protein [Cyanobacteria bacterium REEB65]